MSNWPRGHADFSSSNWTARTSSKPRDTAWYPINRHTRFDPSSIFKAVYVVFLIIGVIPLTGLLLGFFGA